MAASSEKYFWIEAGSSFLISPGLVYIQCIGDLDHSSLSLPFDSNGLLGQAITHRLPAESRHVRVAENLIEVVVEPGDSLGICQASNSP